MRLAFRLIALLPLSVLQALGAFIGWLLWLLPNSRRNTAITNVSKCFPELAPAGQRRLAREALRHEVTTFFETPLVWLGSDARVLGLVKRWDGLEIFDKAMKPGKGAILLSPHQGAFEAGAIPLAATYKIAGIYKPQKGAVNDLSVQGRSRFNSILVPSADGNVGAQITTLLGKGYAVYFLPDQDPPRGRGVFAPFFGIPAHTPKLVSRMAKLRPDLPIVLMWVERLPRAAGFVVHFREPSPGIRDPDPVKSATSLNADIEAFVRSAPEQYWGGYKRFRRRPPGEPPFYAGA
jgi:KDO2-lipid IV(A) lauroyltransferase